MVPEMNEKDFWIFDPNARLKPRLRVLPARCVHDYAEPAYLVPRCLDDYGESAFFAGYLRPAVDAFDLGAIVAQVEPGKPRTVRADKSDRPHTRSRFTSASLPLNIERDGALSLSCARPAGEALASPASPASSSRAAAASWPQRLPATFDMDAATPPQSRSEMASTAALIEESSKLPRPVGASRAVHLSMSCLIRAIFRVRMRNALLTSITDEGCVSKAMENADV